jgi:hypothetical protein
MALVEIFATTGVYAAFFRATAVIENQHISNVLMRLALFLAPALKNTFVGKAATLRSP